MPHPRHPRKIFIPGLGADERLFALQLNVFKNSYSPKWIAPRKTESLADYACRWSKILKLEPGCCLVGVSFRGMIALELAKWVKPRAVLLVSSCRNAESIPLALRILSALPGRSVIGKTLSRVLPSMTGWFLGGETAEQRKLLIRMYLQTPNDFLDWTMQAIRGWEGVKGGRVKIRHIHGEKDHLIPAHRIRADQLVQGGGHLISLTHPNEVNDFIKKHSE